LTDHLELCALWRQVDRLHAEIRPDFFTCGEDPARSKLYLDRIVDDADQELLVAEGPQALRGLIHLQLYETPRSTVFADRRRAHVEDLVVDAAWRRQGIGTALLRAGEDWARQQRADQLVLTVWSGNEPGLAFYDDRGYHPVSRVLAKELR
jgi:ribosomal protein S18 acetylase RimI-like enzyme